MKWQELEDKKKDALYNAVLNHDARFGLLTSIFETHIHYNPKISNFPILTREVVEEAKKVTRGEVEEIKNVIAPFYHFNSQDASDPQAFNKYGVDPINLTINSRSRLQWPTAGRFTNPKDVWRLRRQRCNGELKTITEVQPVRAIYIYHNDHDFSFRGLNYLDLPPETPCPPYPTSQESTWMRRCDVMIVQTSFGFWILNKLNMSKIVDVDKLGDVFRTIETDLHRSLYLKDFEQKTHGPRNQTEFHDLQVFLEIANAEKLRDLNLSLKYFTRMKEGKIITI
jgi:hypothetical protein